MRKEIRIAGFGGQGVISIGVLLAKGLGQFDGKAVAQTQSYGPESRGGACKTDVVTADEELDYIKPLNLDALLVMSQPALDLYGEGVGDHATLLIDSTLVHKVPPRFGKVWSIAATAIAEEELGLRVVANVVMFGALAAATGWVSEDTCKKALADIFPPKVLGKNIAAFDAGFARVRPMGGNV